MEALEDHLQHQIEHSRNFFWHRLRWRAIARQLPRDRPFEVVDVGAGAGLLGMFLQREFPLATYRFVEPLDTLVHHLIQTYGSAADANHLAHYAGAGYVTLLDVIEHIEDDRAFLAQLIGRLDPGTRIFVTVPAMASLWSGWDVALGHFRRYSRHSLRSLAAELPVTVLEVRYLFPEMVPLALLRKRQRPSGAGAEAADESAQFPVLPQRVNDLLYVLGQPSLWMRRLMPLGTSLLAVLEVVERRG